MKTLPTKTVIDRFKFAVVFPIVIICITVWAVAMLFFWPVYWIATGKDLFSGDKL